jgi:hypothetical protein
VYETSHVQVVAFAEVTPPLQATGDVGSKERHWKKPFALTHAITCSSLSHLFAASTPSIVRASTYCRHLRVRNWQCNIYRQVDGWVAGLHHEGRCHRTERGSLLGAIVSKSAACRYGLGSFW